MQTSQSIIELSKALFKFQSRVGKINKDSVNPFHKSKYASLANILDSIHGELNECGLILTQAPGGQDGCVTLTTTVIHVDSGEYISSMFSMVPAKQDPQAICSCITYMRRYAITSVFMLNVDDDDDGNAASRVGQKQEKKISDKCRDTLSELDKCDSDERMSEIVDKIKSSSFTEDEKFLLREKVKSTRARL